MSAAPQTALYLYHRKKGQDEISAGRMGILYVVFTCLVMAVAWNIEHIKPVCINLYPVFRHNCIQALRISAALRILRGYRPAQRPFKLVFRFTAVAFP